MRVFDGLAHSLMLPHFCPLELALFAILFLGIKTRSYLCVANKILVHDQSGLFLSFRGALAFKEHISFPVPSGHSPGDCPSPCMTACPVNAFDSESYNITACKSHVMSTRSQTLRTKGVLPGVPARYLELWQSTCTIRIPYESVFVMA